MRSKLIRADVTKLADAKKMIWNTNFAYALGLITSDGNLSSDGRHLAFISTDMDLIETFKKCLDLKNRVSLKKSDGYSMGNKKKCYVVQFGNVKLYNFLTDIGLGPNKSKTIGSLLIPPAYLADFLRGLIDGDGSIGYFMHPESKRKQFRIRITSASRLFLEWLRKRLTMSIGIKGSIEIVPRAFQLNYYKDDSKKIVKFMYYSKDVPCLDRKFAKAKLIMCEGGETGIRSSLRS